MIEKPLSDILNSSHHNGRDISVWIEQNIEQQEALHEVLSAIHKSPKYFHIAIEYAEESIRRWNYVHPKILDSLEFIFTNFENLSEENAYITDFLRFNGNKLLQNKHILEKISQIDESKLHPTLQLRLVEHFQNDFQHNLLLKNHKTWYKNIIKNLSKTRPEFIQTLISSRPQDLFEKFDFSLTEGYNLFFQITQTHGVFTQAHIEEMAYLRRLGSEKIFEALMNMDFDDFCNFINRFADKYNHNNINFLAFNSLQNLSKEKRFYLSLVYSKKIFEENETDDFFSFILENIDKNRGEIFEKNNFKKIDEILQFLSKEQISIFGNTQIFIKFVEIVEKNELYISYFHDYLNSLSQGKNFSNDRQITFLLQSLKIQNQKLAGYFYNFLIWELLKFHSLESFIRIEERFGILAYPYSTFDIRNYLLNLPVKTFGKISYKNLEKFLIIIFTKLDMSEYGIIDFLENFSKGNRKMKYLSVKIAKKLGIDTKSYQFKSIRERCFFQSSFPLNVCHWTKMQFDK